MGGLFYADMFDGVPPDACDHSEDNEGTEEDQVDHNLFSAALLPWNCIFDIWTMAGASMEGNRAAASVSFSAIFVLWICLLDAFTLRTLCMVRTGVESDLSGFDQYDISWGFNRKVLESFGFDIFCEIFI